MKFSFTYIFPAIASTLLFFSCAKDREDLSKPALMPNALYYQFQENGRFLHGSEIEQVEMFYTKAGDTTNYVPWHNLDAYGRPLFQQVSPEATELFENGVCGSAFIDGLLKEKINTFYFRFPNGDIDTLYLEHTNVGNEEGKNYDCRCAYPIIKILFNGNAAVTHQTLKALTGKPIFIFNKD